MPTTIHLFGNPDLPDDSLAPRLRLRLQSALPELSFRVTDPNELDLPRRGEDFIAIDVVDGLRSVREISPNEIAANNARATTHDFDLTAYLLLVRKLRKEIGIHIYGIPMHSTEDRALQGLIPLLRSLSV